MASKRPIRCLFSTASSALRAAPSKAPLVRTSACTFSTTRPAREPEYDTEGADKPRWQQTPPRMMAPFRVRPLPRGGPFKVNEDPKRLDDVYIRMLGPGGDKVLGDEVKWLAVTHKSFDHGRRGFNDRLAYLGTWGNVLKHGGRCANGVLRTTNNRTADNTSTYKLTAREPMAKR
jgi:large subunit ribosomal protein L15